MVDIAQKYLCLHAILYTYTTAGYPEKGFAWSWLLYRTSACGQVWSLSMPTFFAMAWFCAKHQFKAIFLLCWRALSWAEGCLKETFYKKKNIKLNWWISLLRPSEWAFWTMFKPKAKQIVEKWSQRPYKSTSSEKVVSVALNLLEVRHAHRLALIIWPQRVHSSTMQTLSNQFLFAVS